MKTEELHTRTSYLDIGALFDWAPDLDRFDAEIDSARASGRGDPLTLAEMECSLDLMEAELIGLKSRPKTDASMASISSLTKLRTRLQGQIALLRRYIDEQ